MLVYVMAAAGIFAGFINGWYYEDPHNTLIYWIKKHLFIGVWHSKKVGILLYVIFAEILFWGLVSGILHRFGLYWKLLSSLCLGSSLVSCIGSAFTGCCNIVFLFFFVLDAKALSVHTHCLFCVGASLPISCVGSAYSILIVLGAKALSVVLLKGMVELIF
ncbi:hypothetical protein SDJN03_08987, partial [Cucurbita argyrosperma subsp. sororia]